MDINRSNACIICILSFNSMKYFLERILTSKRIERTKEMLSSFNNGVINLKLETKTKTETSD